MHLRMEAHLNHSLALLKAGLLQMLLFAWASVPVTGVGSPYHFLRWFLSFQFNSNAAAHDDDGDDDDDFFYFLNL